ncbi:sulfotransferase [Mycolicibacterium sp. HK-90]|uniref:sulfotransferase family protein n=1 Tax=Mycolicibacterium sp. HK-90 TaxID=3056937 RepID=UPI002659FBBC|nr:sulfotransferase [Mycolicibacterium sp. HK-90]WKG01067.1 sulfotransferase [Mycolicibacterium sp. HK-90]
MPTVEDIKAAAVEQTGLTDFGDDSFEEGLAILLSALDAEARLNARGEAFLYPRITGYLAQRLQVEDWYRRHPEIDEVPIVAPVIGLGLPRTGSTALSMLLAQDPGVRYLRKWESAQPCPPPSTRADSGLPEGKGEMVGTRYHVPTDTHGPMECHELMALDFKSHLFQSFAKVPTYSTWLVEKADLTPTLTYQRRVMKLLQWSEPHRPWRLKCPSHVLWLDAIDQTFPDARFVMTHRDPTDVILSVADLYADIIGTFTDHIDLAYIGRLNVEHWSLGMDRALQFRAEGGRDRFYDIDFRAIQADPIGEITRLYTWLGQPVTDEFAARMDSWWTQADAEREASSHADPAVFDIDMDQVRPRFARYIEHATRWTTRARRGDTHGD